ncbi:MAG: hypothetical protein AAF391_13350 [Bacteroidota bacterium]
MVILIELLGYILLEFLLTIPGGIVRWIYLKFTGKNRSLEYCFKNKVYANYGITVGILVVIGVINIIL